MSARPAVPGAGGATPGASLPRPARSGEPSDGKRTERGSATAEVALVLPAVVVVLLAVLLAATVGTAQLRCADAARAGARSAALGAGPASVAATASAAAGEGAQVSVVVGGEWLHVTVTRHVATPFGGSITVTATAAALAEPGSP